MKTRFSAFLQVLAAELSRTQTIAAHSGCRGKGDVSMNPLILTIIILVIVVVAVVLGLVFWFISGYNKLVKLSSRVDNSWAQIDVQLKQRFDLIPNLVETVKGFASHEKSLLEDVTKWRAAALHASSRKSTLENSAHLDQAVRNLFVSVEQYPEVCSNANFLDLQARLTELEKKVAISRQFYNDTVMRYNEAIEQMPGRLIAGMFHFEPKEYFQAFDNERSAPQVKF